MTDSTVRTFDEQQIQRLAAIQRAVDTTLPPRDMLRDLVRQLAAIVRAKAAFVEKRDGLWTVVAESADAPPLPEAGDATWRAFDRVARSLGRGAMAWQHGAAEWTLVGLRPQGDAPVILMLEGDWTASGSALLQLSDALLFAERAVAMASQSQLAMLTHRLTRALVRTTSERGVCETVLRSLVRAVPSRIASFAVAMDDDRLAILATHGYPRTLVEHVRIAPGTGVLGSVYRTRAPLRVADAGTFPGLERRRPRYRTPSFVALPILAGPDVLGVVSLADRADDGAFTREDLAVLRAMVAPVSLALARERQRRQAEAFARAAAIDPVSGLYNRRYFQARLDEELQRARRMDTPVALLMIDVDDFKAINDHYGHIAGDMVIADLADILRNAVRVFDVCTRFGGEEFAVLMPGNRQEHAARTAERIRERIEAYRPADPAFADLRVTVSIGLAMAAADSTPRDLLERADRALYAAKREGKNRLAIGD